MVSSNQRRRKISAEEWQRIEADYALMTGEEVAAKYGISINTLYARQNGRGKLARARAVVRRTPPSAAAHHEAPWWTSWWDGCASGVRRLRRRLCVGCRRRWRAVTRKQRRSAMRRQHSQEIWAAARRDYELGATAPAVAERYGMTHHAVKRRARVEGWDKTVRAAPAPLVAPDDPAQVDGAGGSVWARIAHEAQRAPEGEWLTWLFQGGRGAGKTRAGAEWLAERAERTPRGRFALVGPTLHDVREVMINGPSGLRSLPGRERPTYESSRRRLEWKNGAVAYAFSAEEPERLRGPQFEAAWADEFCVWPKPEETLALLRMGLRLGDDPRLVVTTTPKPILGLRKLRAEASCVTTQAPTRVNAAHLSPSFLSGLEALYGGTRLAQQELEGVMLDGEGALWTAEMLEKATGARPEKLDWVVVAVDPPASTAGVCGIVAAGRAGKRAYVLEDASVAAASPLGWARRVAEAARRHGAHWIVAEANQGGDMVRANLAAADVKQPVKLVHASKGKRVRAEPVAALYEQGRVTHCVSSGGPFLRLEEEMMALGVSNGGAGEGRLDRADALVWALTWLMLEGNFSRPMVINVWDD